MLNWWLKVSFYSSFMGMAVWEMEDEQAKIPSCWFHLLNISDYVILLMYGCVYASHNEGVFKGVLPLITVLNVISYLDKKTLVVSLYNCADNKGGIIEMFRTKEREAKINFQYSIPVFKSLRTILTWLNSRFKPCLHLCAIFDLREISKIQSNILPNEILCMHKETK